MATKKLPEKSHFYNKLDKLFESIYALYSGVAFLTSVAVIFSPIVHRFLHKFRIDVEDNTLDLKQFNF